MSFNKDLAGALENIALMLELLGEDRFRIAAHARAARIVADHPADLSAMDRKGLLAIDGIGAKVADKIVEFQETGRINERDALARRIPAGLLDILAIPGLGPKTVRLIWDRLGVTDLDGLSRAIEDGSLLALPRMGAKTVENIRASMAFLAASGERLPLGQAFPIAEDVAEMLAGVPGVLRVAIAGSARRGRETIGDIDLLVATTEPDAAAEAFTTMPGVQQVLAKGKAKSSIRLPIATKPQRWKGADEVSDRAVQIDLRVIDERHWGAGLMYFTGSKQHNVRMRERAITLGLTLNEYGLFPLDDEQTPPQSRRVEPVASRQEADIFARLELPMIPPELREDRGELDLTETPRLVELADIKAELHAHTTASDGALELAELVALAKSRGFHTIAVTDHSRSSVYAGGLSPERLRRQIEAIRACNEEVEDITVLAGSEVDILSDGSLDYDDDLLAELDVVVASPHAALGQDPAKATARLLRAIEHPLVHIVGHPTGRLIGRRPGLEPAMDELIAAAVEHGTALEINAHWMRLDLRDAHVRAAVDAGAVITIDCDVHELGDFDNLRYGVLTGRRGRLTPDLCVNTWSKRQLYAWLKKKRR